MTEEEWVQQALSTIPPMSEGKKVRLALIFREAENDPDHW